MRKLADLSFLCFKHAPMEPTCEMEIHSFQSGGTTGLVRLKQVLPSLFRYYRVDTIEAMQTTLRRCNLVPVLEGHYVTFRLDVPPGEDLSPREEEDGPAQIRARRTCSSLSPPQSPPLSQEK